MFFDGEFRQIGSVDHAPLMAAVRALDPELWDEHAARQSRYRAHAMTRTIPLIYDEDMRHTAPTRRAAFDGLEGVLAPAMARIRAFFARAHEVAGSDPLDGYFVRAVLVVLAAGAEVRSHTDHGPSLSRAHRIHLPVVTHDKVLFAVAGNIRHLPAGELWEINNRKPHAVRNAGPERIHAILDYVVPGELVDDPDGLLRA